MNMKRVLLIFQACALLMVGLFGTFLIAFAEENTPLSPILIQDENGVVLMDESNSSSVSDDAFLLDLNARMEKEAALSKELMEKGEYQRYFSVLPAANDLSVEAAIDTAKKAIIDKYAVKEEVFDLFRVFADLRVTDAKNPNCQMLALPENEKRTWFISFSPRTVKIWPHSANMFWKWTQ